MTEKNEAAKAAEPSVREDRSDLPSPSEIYFAHDPFEKGLNYQVWVSDNYEIFDPDGFRGGFRKAYGTEGEAIAACKAIVDKSLSDMWRHREDKIKTPEELYGIYTGFGLDPWIRTPRYFVKCDFSGWEYAKVRCEELLPVFRYRAGLH